MDTPPHPLIGGLSANSELLAFFKHKRKIKQKSSWKTTTHKADLYSQSSPTNPDCEVIAINPPATATAYRFLFPFPFNLFPILYQCCIGGRSLSSSDSDNHLSLFNLHPRSEWKQRSNSFPRFFLFLYILILLLGSWFPSKNGKMPHFSVLSGGTPNLETCQSA